MKTKNLLLFLFTVAFMSLLSTNAFAQWGSTVTASGDTEFLKAIHDPSVEYVVLSEGYYSNIGRKIFDGETFEKKKPEGGATSNSLKLKSAQITPDVCTQGYVTFPNQCFNSGPVGNSIVLTASAIASGTAICPNPVGWICSSATINGSNISLPTLISSPDPYIASVTGFTEGGIYIFQFYWDDASYISTSDFKIWKNPVFTLTSPLNICINALPTTLSANVTPQYVTSTTTNYSWSSSPGGTITNPTSATPTFNASTSGDYTVTLTVDENVNPIGTVNDHDCSTTHTMIIHVSDSPTANAGPDKYIGACAAQSTILNGSGTGDAISYSWSPGTYLSATNIAQPTFTGAPIGTYSYTLTVTNRNKCTATDAVNVTVVRLPTATVPENQTIGDCQSYNINATATPANAEGLTYLWTGTGAGYLSSTSIEDPIFQSTAPPGTYTLTLTITDNFGCTVATSFTITVAPALVASIAGQTNVLCFGNATGSATVSVSGGSAPYLYSWNTTPVQTTTTATGLVAGTYMVTVTDANKCTTTASVTITQPRLLSAVIETQTNVLCFGDKTGSAFVYVSGGTGPYSYLWSNGTTTATATGLAAGTYTVTVTDANHCTTIVSVTITQPVAALSASLNGTNVLCFGNATGSATVSPSGGTVPYSYSWNTTPVQTGATATGLVAGTYTVTVTDANKCTTTASVIITQPAAGLTATIAAPHTNVLCFGNATGSATVSASGGTVPYSYSWNTTPVQTGATATGLTAGTYTVTVTDANKCTTTASVTITQPTAPLSATITAQTNVLCFNASTGAVNLTVSGGTTAYTYLWSNGATIEDLTSLSAGTYTVTVTDANHCTTTASVTITQPKDKLSASISGTNVLCYGASAGFADLTVSGGTPTYTYLWSNGATTEDLASVLAGTYTVTVTDANLCTTTASVTITRPGRALSASITAHTNVLCFGAATGSATVSASGGTPWGGAGVPSYTYSWIPSGQTTQTATGLTAGTYTVTVTDANGCTTTASVTITQPKAKLSASISGTNVLCYGGSTGAANLTVTDGTPGYTYLWSNGSTTEDLTSLSAGIYNVLVTDANGCTITASVTITQPVAALTASIAAPHTDVLCFGAATGSATVSVSGGTGNYSYSWNTVPVQTTATATGLLARTYTVTVTDANKCTTTASVTITQPRLLSAVIETQTNVLCFGDKTGSAFVYVSGGTGPYSYLWSNGTTTATAMGLAAGTYTVTVTDANHCTTIVSVTITQPVAALSASLNGTNVLCFGNATGSATVSPSGGTVPYSYSWNTTPVQTGATATGLVAGTYTVTVTDANKCTTTASVIITQPAAGLTATIAAPHTNVLCFGNSTGSATGSASGGTVPYSYSWNTTPVQTGATATGLTAGTYMVTVIDANKCTTTASVTITQPAAALTAVISYHSNVLCFGDATATAIVSVSGGTPGGGVAGPSYTYLWNPSGQTTPTATGLAAGTYTVTVTDANGCTTTASVTITQPDALTASIVEQTNVLCFGNATGSAFVAVSGGSGNYSYSWNTIPVQTTATATGLSAGTYTVTVTDEHKCTTTATVTITQPARALSASILGQTDVLCYGNATGSATVSASGGTVPYSYSWNTTPAQTGATATGLTAGTYSVTVTDANGCTTTASVTITQPVAALTASIAAPHTDVLCFGAATSSATVSVSGGTEPYTYSWNTTPVQTTTIATGLVAGTYTVTVTDGHKCTTTASVTITQPRLLSAVIETQTNVLCFGDKTGSAFVYVSGGTGPYSYSWDTTPAQTTATATGLAAGTYTVTVTDANHCTTTVSVTITQPAAALSVSLDGTNVLCFGNATGSATVSPSGGTVPYSYSWNTTPVQTGATATGLVAGTYTVTVTDANKCTTTASVTITQPAAGLTATIAEPHTNVLCFGNATGSATVSASGGTVPYSYSWNTTPVQTGATATGLTAGTYMVTVIDANKCTTTASVTITQPAAALTAVISYHSNVLCFGDATATAIVSVSGGTPGSGGVGPTYSYSWNTTPTAQNTATATGLAAGTYTVTVTDANGCTTTASVTITQPDALTATIGEQTNVLCFGNATGSAFVAVSGGSGNYLYSWNTTPVQTTATATGLSAGTYTVTVTDEHKCTTTATVTITQPVRALSASIADQTNVLCFGNATGSATVSASGGTGPYSYSWNTTPVQTGVSATGLAAGTYIVTITDANGCTTTASVTITQPDSLTASIAEHNVLCFGNSTGSASVAVSGGTETYTYLWSPSGQTTQTAIGLSAGTYIVTVTDANKCTTTASVTITEQPDFDVICPKNITVCSEAALFNLIDLGGFGTVPSGIPGNYQFYEGITPVSTFNPVVDGTQTITYTFTNDLGCSKSCSFVITVEPMGEISLEGQVKYWNENETFMQTPFTTDIYGTFPHDYYYVALYESTATINLSNPLANAVDWQTVDITQEEDGAGNITKDLMSYFKFKALLDPAKQYYLTVWDGSNLHQEFMNLGTTTGLAYNPELGSAWTWNNFGGLSGLDVLGIQSMINGATDMNLPPISWTWIGNKVVPGDKYYGYFSNSIADVNSVNIVSALDALNAQYRLAGLLDHFPNNTPNFRVAGRFVSTLPEMTWDTPFVKSRAPIDLEFTKSSANYTYFTPAIKNYYKSNDFSVQPFYNAQNDAGSIGQCPEFGYVNIYYNATGDVNSSYVMPSEFLKSAKIASTLQYENEIAVQKGEIIDIPIRVDRGAELGSIVVGLTFRNDLIKVLEVPGYNVVNINNEKGFVRVVWADVNGRTVNADEAIVTVKALILAEITADTHLFELEAMTELGNFQAQPIINYNLKTIALSTKPVVSSEMFLNNYPNPFKNKTTISYNLPEDGTVKLVVYNSLGAEITTLVNQYQTAGPYLKDLDRSGLAPGIYSYRLVLQGKKEIHAVSRNMVITR